MRGSTCPEPRWRHGRDGFPAHAGIDPACPRSQARSRRLPRACGDRPDGFTATSMTMEASPRMRGSTPQRPPGEDDAAGFPAHAGIDPLRRGRRAPRRGLPRACGDRPEDVARGNRVERASPRMRGSTRRRSGEARPMSGFPAHAGIDPCPFRSPARSRWLPRACGDRPCQGRCKGLLLRASPRMRGSTHGQGDEAGEDAGFPAHAGIDPRAARRGTTRAGLPRACGDRPSVEALSLAR